MKRNLCILYLVSRYLYQDSCFVITLVLDCMYDREGIIASGAADDCIRLFVENNESLVWKYSFFSFGMGKDAVLSATDILKHWQFKFLNNVYMICIQDFSGLN